MRIISPFEALRALTDRLPDSVAAWVWNITYLLAWISIPFTILGTLWDLRLAVQFIYWLFAQLPSLAQFFAPLIEPLSQVLLFWRQITDPLARLMVEWGLPFPRYLADFAMLGIFLVPSFFRYLFQRLRYLSSRTEREKMEQEMAASSGIGGGLGGGALIGAVIGSALGPFGTFAGGALGGALGGGLSEGAFVDYSEHSRLSAAEQRDQRRLRQATLLVRVSMSVVILLLLLLLADGFGLFLTA